MPANADPTVAAATVLRAARRVIAMLLGLQSTVYGRQSHAVVLPVGAGRWVPGLGARRRYSECAMSLYDELKWRGLVYDATDGARDVLAGERVVGYIGFDPTASSLHVGSLLVMMALAHMQRQGHSPIALVGGGTGLIGDPSGKTSERQLLTPDRVEENVEGIRSQLARFLDFDIPQNPA